jgi:adenylate cyclase
MYTDMVGYTALGQRNEALSLALVEEQRKLIRPILDRHHGREVKTMGDGLLIEFSSALDAVRCSYDIQRTIREFNFSLAEDRRIHLRVGIHLGDVIDIGGDISGDAVNVASRIEPLAEDGGVCVTRQVHDGVQSKFELEFHSLGQKPLKNVKDPQEVFAMVMPWSEGSSPSPTKDQDNRVAVLPFRNMSADVNDEYFAEGMTEEIISAISRIPDLGVISRTSVTGYKNTNKKAAEIARELNVGTLLEGSVRKAGNRVRITVQLINAREDRHLWVENYDRNVEDIFVVQSEVADKVASSLHLRFTEQDKQTIERGGTSSVEAYTLFLKGRLNINRWDKAPLLGAIGYFEQALTHDSGYALAYCGLAWAYSKLGFQDIMNPVEANAKAELYAKKALELNDSLAEAHLSLAYVLVGHYDFEGREKELRKALELNPSLAEAYLQLGTNYAFMLRWNECLRAIEKALEVDPLSVNTSGNAGTWYLYAGEYDKAIKHLEDALELDPSNTFYLDNLGLAHIHKGLVEQGLQEVEKAVRMSGTPISFGDLAWAYVQAGRPDEARRLLTRLQQSENSQLPSPTAIAGIYAVLGEKEKALDWLERAYEEHSGYLPSVNGDFVFDSIKGEPRFRALLGKMNLARISD